MREKKGKGKARGKDRRLKLPVSPLFSPTLPSSPITCTSSSSSPRGKFRRLLEIPVGELGTVSPSAPIP